MKTRTTHLITAVLCCMVAGIAYGSAVQKTDLLFDEFDGPSGWGKRSVGTQWTFFDVFEGVNLRMTLEDVTHNSELKVETISDAGMKITIRDRIRNNPTADFLAEFIRSDTQEAQSVNFDFIFKDFDTPGGFAEQLQLNNVDSYSKTADSNMSITPSELGILAQAVLGVNTHHDDQRSWLVGSFLDVDSFRFTWGFDGMGNNSGSRQQRGMLFDGRAESIAEMEDPVIEIAPPPVGQSGHMVPTPAAAPAIAMGLLVIIGLAIKIPPPTHDYTDPEDP